MKPGNPNNYPFDSYDASIFINASILPTNDDLPLTLFIIGDVEGFTYTTQFQSNDGGSPIEITFDIRRNTTSRIFAAIFFLRECAR
jgi:hypothetical protein